MYISFMYIYIYTAEMEQKQRETEEKQILEENLSLKENQILRWNCLKNLTDGNHSTKRN